MRVRENFVTGGSVKRPAFRILDARVEIERSLFSAAGVVDAIRAGQRIYIFMVKIEIALERAKLRSFRDSAERIFGCDLRKFERGLYHAVEAGAGKIAGVCAGSALAIEDAHANRS